MIVLRLVLSQFTFLVYWVSNGPGPEACGLIAGSRCEGGEDRWLDGEPLPATF